MKSVRDRYLTDNAFRTIVESMRAIIYGAHLTPSEVREAAVLACILEEERKPIEPITEEEMERMRQHFIVPAAQRMADENKAIERTLEESGECCIALHANATPPWTCKCQCHERDILDFAAKQQAETTRQLLRDKGHDV